MGKRRIMPQWENGVFVTTLETAATSPNEPYEIKSPDYSIVRIIIVKVKGSGP